MILEVRFALLLISRHLRSHFDYTRHIAFANWKRFNRACYSLTIQSILRRIITYSPQYLQKHTLMFWISNGSVSAGYSRRMHCMRL